MLAEILDFFSRSIYLPDGISHYVTVFQFSVLENRLFVAGCCFHSDEAGRISEKAVERADSDEARYDPCAYRFL